MTLTIPHPSDNGRSLALVDVEGELCIRHPYEMSSEPTITVYYWPIGIRTREAKSYWANFIAHGEVTFPVLDVLDRYVDGVYITRPSWWCGDLRVRLKDGTSTKAIKIDHVAIPCPPVRRGIETRWRDGRWQKYLKREGWVWA